MTYWFQVCSEILARVMIILGILGADILFWIAGIVLYVCSEIAFKMQEKKDKGDD